MHGFTDGGIHTDAFNQGTTHITISKSASHGRIGVGDKENKRTILDFIKLTNCVKNRKALRNNIGLIHRKFCKDGKSNAIFTLPISIQLTILSAPNDP